jgi:O-antigen ligase
LQKRIKGEFVEYPTLLNDDTSSWPYDLQPKETLPLSIFLLMPFLVGVVAVSAIPGFNYLVIGLGAICAVVFLMASAMEGFFVPTELKYFMAFGCWGILGLFTARFPEAVVTGLRTLTQLVIMALIISYYARNMRCVSWLFFAVLIGVLIVSVSAVITGEFQMAEVEGEAARLAGLTLNANAFAITVVYGVTMLLYYFRMVRSKTLKLLIIGGILLSVRFVIASGSRTGFLGLAILVFFWFLFNYAKELGKRPFLVVVMLLGIVGFGCYTAYLMRDTVLTQRFLRLEAKRGTEGSTGTRLFLVKEGINFTLSNPVLGVGLGNFRFRSVTDRYAHDNYVEFFADTGIPGGILYNMIYVLIFYRLYKISKFPLTPGQKNAVAIFKCLMMLQISLDFATVSYYTKINWIFLAIIIGYLSYLKRDLEAAYSQDYDAGEYSQITLSQSTER